MPSLVRRGARATTDTAGSVHTQACRQPLTRDYECSVLGRRSRSSAAAITRLGPGDPDRHSDNELCGGLDTKEIVQAPSLALGRQAFWFCSRRQRE